MNTFTHVGLRWTVILYTTIHFITFFWENTFLLTLLSISGIALFIFAFLYHAIKKFKLPLFIMTIATIVTIASGDSLQEAYFYGVLQMRNIIGLLIIVPLISWVLHEEPYIEDIMSLFYRFVHTSRRFYFSLVAFTQVISYFLLFGAIPIMYEFINVILGKQTSEAWEIYKGTALLRGFALTTLWVISIPSFIFAVETLEAPLGIAILQGFGIAFLGTLLATLFAYLHEKRTGISMTPVLQENITNILRKASPNNALRKQNVLEFILLFVLLFGSIFLIHHFFNVPLMIVIPLAIIFWIAIFYLFKRKAYKLPKITNDYAHDGMLKQTYQLSVMLAIGVLILTLRKTSFATVLVNGLQFVENEWPLINPLFLLPFLVIILGFFGLGPLTVMVLVAGIVSDMNLPYQPELIVLAITSGSVISSIISPVIMSVIILSASNGLSILTNGIKANWKYSIAFYIIVQLYIQLRIL